MEKLIYLAGVASSLGGVCLFIFQGLTYLKDSTWTQYTVLLLVEHGPSAIRDQVQVNPQLASALESCPLFLALIVLGLFLLFIGSKVSNRYI